jgi:4-methyl-5(b-hydroxyethyl)-thiazole monophosphate biosynthesis
MVFGEWDAAKKRGGHMPKVIVVLADGFEEVEAMSVVDVLRRAEIETTIAGLHDGPVLSARKVRVIPDTVIDAVESDDFDMIVLPGGQPGADNMNQDLRLKSMIKSFSDKKKVLGAICAAPLVLAGAGILRGKRVTSYPSYKNKLGDVLYEEKTVVQDGNILTSRGAGTALLFALAIVERLVGKEKAQRIKEAMLV